MFSIEGTRERILALGRRFFSPFAASPAFAENHASSAADLSPTPQPIGAPTRRVDPPVPVPTLALTQIR